MNLVALQSDTIALHEPLPFTLRGVDGALLAYKGYVVRSRGELQAMIERGRGLNVDTHESGESYRAYLARLQQMLLDGKSLGQIASTKIMASSPPGAAPPRKRYPDWPQLQMQASHMLRAPQAEDFHSRFSALHAEVAQHCRHSPDAVLLALVHLSAQETRQYSATHALLMASVCMVTARETLRWPEERVLQLGRAALTTNIAMTSLQDTLTQQHEPLRAQQIEAIETHAQRAHAMLRTLGVDEEAWLHAVRDHHQREPGPLSGRTPAGQMARLIQRADIFGARIAPRATRAPMLVTAAMQASYYDEKQQVDEAGSALVKTMGIYPPGTPVRLASQEIALVVRRGERANTPRVVVLVNREGLPTGEPIPRDTAQPAWRIAAPLASKELRVQVPFETLLALLH